MRTRFAHRLSYAAVPLLFACAAGEAPPRDLLQPAPDASVADAGPSEVCRLPPMQGPCEAAMQRWAFRPASGLCEPFLYGGCGGNANNFDSKAACEAACGAPEPVACGGRAGQTCAEDEFCDFANDGCDWADASGVCRPRPNACTEEYAPVCGCDGQTHGNLCSAQAAGTDAARAGACAQTCAPGRDSIVAGGGYSFGLCASGCRATLEIAAGPGACDVVELEICDNGPNAPCTQHTGTLSAAAHAEARSLAAALVGTQLDRTYGCPDCADGGAARLTLLRQGQRSEHVYEYFDAPKVFEDADAFVRGLIEDLEACQSSARVTPDSGCVPR